MKRNNPVISLLIFQQAAQPPPPFLFFLFCAFSRTLGSNHTAPHEHSHMFHHSGQRPAFFERWEKVNYQQWSQRRSAVFSIWHRVYYRPPLGWVACDDISLITRLPAEGRGRRAGLWSAWGTVKKLKCDSAVLHDLLLVGSTTHVHQFDSLSPSSS